MALGQTKKPVLSFAEGTSSVRMNPGINSSIPLKVSRLWKWPISDSQDIPLTWIIRYNRRKRPVAYGYLNQD